MIKLKHNLLRFFWEFLLSEMCFYSERLALISFSLLTEYQKVVLAKLITIQDSIDRLQRNEPSHAASNIQRLDSLDEFHHKEDSLSDGDTFNTLVKKQSFMLSNCTNHKATGKLLRIGGRTARNLFSIGVTWF